MAHIDAGHYANKHQNRAIDIQIATTLKQETTNSTITCAKLHNIAKSLEVKPKDIGIQADLLELRLKECSLGLFGYEPNGKNFNKDIQISDQLSSEIRRIATNGRTSCIQCWEVASKLNIEKMDIGSACEKMGIKIKNCQLGAF